MDIHPYLVVSANPTSNAPTLDGHTAYERRKLSEADLDDSRHRERVLIEGDTLSQCGGEDMAGRERHRPRGSAAQGLPGGPSQKHVGL